MKIEHVAMYVHHLEQTKDFFTHYFDAAAGDKYYNAKTGFESYFLTFEDGCRLEIMRKPEMTDMDPALVHTGYAHIALSVGSKEKVDAFTKQLKNDGYKIISGPRTTGDGYYESCFVDAEGNQIELTV